MHLRQAPTAAQALFRVFVQPCALSSPTRRLLQPQLLVTEGRRNLSKYRKVKPEATSQSLFKDPSKPVDEAIQASKVHLVRDGTLESDQPLKSLLQEVKRLNEQKKKDGGTKGDTIHIRQHATHGDGKPIVKFITEREAWTQLQAQIKKPKTVEDKGKQLELNWGLDQRGDLPHRLTRLKEFLEDGRRVEILLANKKGGRRATIQEMEALLDQLRAAAAEVEGGEELKAMEGKLGGRATLFFGIKDANSTRSAKAKQETPEAEEMEDKKARREREREERRAKEAERQRRAEERAAELEKQRDFKVDQL